VVVSWWSIVGGVFGIAICVIGGLIVSDPDIDMYDSEAAIAGCGGNFAINVVNIIFAGFYIHYLHESDFKTSSLSE